MSDILIKDFVTGLLILMRIFGMFLIAPAFGNKSVPQIAKLGLSIIITYIIFFSMNPYEFNIESGIIELALLSLKELLTGFIMGITLNMVFYGISFSGLLIDRDIGLVMAQMFDPTTESQSNITGLVLTSSALLIFILINGHHYVIKSLSYSFTIIPLGYYSLNGDVFSLLIKYSASLFVIGVKIASPIMVAFFLLHVATGIIARVSPKIQIFFVILPIKTALGFFLLTLMVPLFIYFIKDMLEIYEDKLFDILQVMGT